MSRARALAAAVAACAVVALRPGPPASGATARSPASAEDRAVDSSLAITPFITHGGHRRRDVALTFDDGPDAWTPRIVAELRRLHAPATFFEIGSQVASHRRVTRRLADDGFPIGDHTETHPLLAHRDRGFQDRQLREAARRIAAAGAPYPRLFRPPYGSFDAVTLSALVPLRMLMVLWSADTDDWAKPGAGRIVEAALSHLRPGAIILMHDGGGDRRQTLAALPTIVHRLRARGYRLVTIPRMLVDDPPARHQSIADGLGPSATAS